MNLYPARVDEVLADAPGIVDGAAFGLPDEEMGEVLAVAVVPLSFPPPADLTPQTYTKFQIHRANSVLAETLWVDNVIVAGSGHNMMLYQPQIVADDIVAIVYKVRSGR